MAEVGIHLKDVVVAVLQRPLETCNISCAKAELAATLNDEQTVLKLVCHQPFNDVGGAIGRSVIDNQNVECFFQTHHGADNLFDVFLLVIGRNNHNAVALYHILILCVFC